MSDSRTPRVQGRHVRQRHSTASHLQDIHLPLTVPLIVEKILGVPCGYRPYHITPHPSATPDTSQTMDNNTSLQPHLCIQHSAKLCITQATAWVAHPSTYQTHLWQKHMYSNRYDSSVAAALSHKLSSSCCCCGCLLNSQAQQLLLLQAPAEPAT